MTDLKKLLDQLEAALPELKKAAGVEEDSESPDEEQAEDDGDMPPMGDEGGDTGDMDDDMGMPPLPLKKKKPMPF